MNKSTNQITEDQIKVLERRRDDILMRIQDRDRSAYALDPEATALTNLLTELRDTREMLEAARKIEFPIEPDDTYHFTSVSRQYQITGNKYGKWKAGCEDYVHDSALAAWRDGVKGEGNANR